MVDLIAAVVITLIGVVLSAVRWQRVLTALEAPTRLLTLVRHYLRRACSSATSCPRPSAGTCCACPDSPPTVGNGPTSFASVVLERLYRLDRAARHLPDRLRRQSQPAGLRQLQPRRHCHRRRHAGAARPRPGQCDQPAHRRPPRRRSEGWRSFIAAVHLGLVRFRQHPAAALEVLVAGFVYQFFVVLGRPPRRRARCGSTSASPRCSPSSPPSPSCRCCRSPSAGSACAKVPWCCSSTPSACPPDQAIALGVADLRHQPRRQPGSARRRSPTGERRVPDRIMA